MIRLTPEVLRILCLSPMTWHKRKPMSLHIMKTSLPGDREACVYLWHTDGPIDRVGHWASKETDCHVDLVGLLAMTFLESFPFMVTFK